MKVIFRVLGLVGCIVTACGGSADLASNSETHFLDYCTDGCGQGLECVCGVCTVTCDPASSCGDLSPNAICRSADLGDSSSCEAESQPSVCDVPCSKDSECQAVDDESRCVSGYCREPGCLYEGEVYAPGESFAATCNTCTCQEDGEVLCTRNACLCEYDGNRYAVGESFPATDGCNTCSCESEDSVVCTERACGAGGVGGTGSGGTGGGAGAGPGQDCFSPTQNLDTAYDGGTGCACDDADVDRCIDGVALVCSDGQWQAVEDGPCLPSTCNQAIQEDPTCNGVDEIYYWHNPATGQCEPHMAVCPLNSNSFASFDDCVASCQAKLAVSAVVPWDSCEGLGQQISSAGDESEYSRDGDLISTELFWGCGCATRPEFVLAYEPTSPLRLRLCHDDLADSCEAGCSGAVSFDLSDAFAGVGDDSFVFVD